MNTRDTMNTSPNKNEMMIDDVPVGAILLFNRPPKMKILHRVLNGFKQVKQYFRPSEQLSKVYHVAISVGTGPVIAHVTEANSEYKFRQEPLAGMRARNHGDIRGFQAVKLKPEFKAITELAVKIAKNPENIKFKWAFMSGIKAMIKPSKLKEPKNFEEHPLDIEEILKIYEENKKRFILSLDRPLKTDLVCSMFAIQVYKSALNQIAEVVVRARDEAAGKTLSTRELKKAHKQLYQQLRSKFLGIRSSSTPDTVLSNLSKNSAWETSVCTGATAEDNLHHMYENKIKAVIEKLRPEGIDAADLSNAIKKVNGQDRAVLTLSIKARMLWDLTKETLNNLLKKENISDDARSAAQDAIDFAEQCSIKQLVPTLTVSPHAAPAPHPEVEVGMFHHPVAAKALGAGMTHQKYKKKEQPQEGVEVHINTKK